MRINSKNLKRAVFLDRDGTILVFVNELIKKSQIRFYRNSVPAIKKLNELGYLCIVVTNQPIIEKGVITKKRADELNKIMREKLQKRGARIDVVYMCPHCHPSDCFCRKPEIGMLLQAQEKFKIDFKKSFVVGDDQRDIEMGRRAKIKTILVRTGKAGKDKRFFNAKPDYIVKDLLEAVKTIEKFS